MENPPDLIVAVTSEDQCYEKKKTFVDNINQEHEQLIANLRSDKYTLEYELEQLRIQLTVRNEHKNEFDEQARLLQQRFHDEIQSVLSDHTELIQHLTNDLSIHVTHILRKSIEHIESLRLLHQKELCTHSINITDCIRHQSCEMTELCEHLIDQQRTKPMNLFRTLTNDVRSALNNLKTSFDSKINYLTDIHSLTVEKMNAKHQNEMDEMKCELTLTCNR